MFTRIQTSGYRSLKSVDQELASFQALVGPNASGKTTFLDVVGFLSDLMLQRGEIVPVVQKRSSNFENLTWMGKGKSFQIAVEAKIPDHVRSGMSEALGEFDRVRYELEVGVADGEVGINHEILWLAQYTPAQSVQVELFPAPQLSTPNLISRAGRGRKVAVKKAPGGNDNYYNEGRRKTYNPSFKLGRARSALANLPADTESFPVSSWFRGYLETGVQPFVLNSQIIQKPSPPGLHRRFRTDGSNLPWVVAELRKDKVQFQSWLKHVRTALPDIVDVATVERPEDRHSYLVVHYANGAAVPSWLASDGTLRLLALTIPAYLSDLDGTFLIEEPENGVHPRALETVLQSLSSVYGGQVLIATHSPIALNLLAPFQILCFAKDSDGATDIVAGDRHPVLRNWRDGEPDLGVLFASGILS